MPASRRHTAWLLYDEAIHRCAQGFDDDRDASEHGACRRGDTLEELAGACGLLRHCAR